MRKLLICIVLITLCSFVIEALEVPSAKGYVNDYAGLLTSTEAQSLDNKLREYDKKTSNQVVVLTVKSLEGDVIESFGLKVAGKWKPGQKGKDNGVIFIIAKDDRQTRIEVGYGLEAVLTDLECALILDKIVKPKFREGKYFEGINGAVESIFKAIGGEFTLSKSDTKNSVDIGFIIFFIMVGFIIVFGSRYKRGGWSTGSFGRSRSSGGSFGGGGFSRGGGFSGGGGGFGGGGASGRW